MSEHMFAKISFETISLQKALWTEIYANQFQQKPRPKNYWKKHFYQKLSEEKSRQYNVRKESPTKKFEETIYQTLIEKKSLTKKIEAEIWGKSYSWKPCIYFRRCPAKNVWNKLPPKQAKLLSVVIGCYQKQAKLLSVVIV